jgi:TRAP-type uncharacterized transport system substrate-binding protein
LAVTAIPAGEYAGQPRIETVATHAVLIVSDAVPTDTVAGIVKALFNPANRPLLAAAHPSARAIRLETATAVLPAPLHPAAARFYAIATGVHAGSAARR